MEKLMNSFTLMNEVWYMKDHEHTCKFYLNH
jgi:hypothetical protein